MHRREQVRAVVLQPHNRFSRDAWCRRSCTFAGTSSPMGLLCCDPPPSLPPPPPALCSPIDTRWQAVVCSLMSMAGMHLVCGLRSDERPGSAKTNHMAPSLVRSCIAAQINELT